MNKNPAIGLVLLAFAAVYILWGTTYVVIVIGLESIPPFIMAAIRFLVAGVVLFLICFFRKENILVKGIYKNLLLGTIILTGGQGLLFWSEQYIPSGTAAIVVSSLPLWYVLLDRKNWSSYFRNPLIMTGLVLGFVGIILLFQKYLQLPENTGRLHIMGMLAVVLACICWAAGTLWHKNHENKYSIFLNIGWQLTGGFISSLIVAMALNEFPKFSLAAVSLPSWLAVLYLAVIGSVVAFVAFNWLMVVRAPAVVGTYAYVNPVIAVILGWLVAGEEISLLQIAGMVIILVSAFLVNSPKYVAMLKKKNAATG